MKLYRDPALATGILALPILFFAVLIFGYLEPEYSHVNQSVSALGAYSAVNTLAMNMIGLALPGLLVTISSVRAVKYFRVMSPPRLAMYLMALFGLMFAALASPMDAKPLPAVGVTVHYILAYASVGPFLLASIIMALYRNDVADNNFSRRFLVVLPLVFICIEVLGGLGFASGLVQRSLLLCIFLWVVVVVLNVRVP